MEKAMKKKKVNITNVKSIKKIDKFKEKMEDTKETLEKVDKKIMKNKDSVAKLERHRENIRDCKELMNISEETKNTLRVTWASLQSKALNKFTEAIDPKLTNHDDAEKMKIRTVSSCQDLGIGTSRPILPLNSNSAPIIVITNSTPEENNVVEYPSTFLDSLKPQLKLPCEILDAEKTRNNYKLDAKILASFDPLAQARETKNEKTISTILDGKKEYAPLKVPWEDLMKLIQTDEPAAPSAITSNPRPGSIPTKSDTAAVAVGLLIDLDADDDYRNIAPARPTIDLTSEALRKSVSIYNFFDKREQRETTKLVRIFSRVDLQTNESNSHEKPEKGPLATITKKEKVLFGRAHRKITKNSKKLKGKQKKNNSKLDSDSYKTRDSEKSSSTDSSWTSMDPFDTGFSKKMVKLEESIRQQIGEEKFLNSCIPNSHTDQPYMRMMMLKRFARDLEGQAHTDLLKPKENFVTRVKNTVSSWFRKKADKPEASKSKKNTFKRRPKKLIRVNYANPEMAREQEMEVGPEKTVLLSSHIVQTEENDLDESAQEKLYLPD